jgi:hypothetical protein
MSKRQLLDPVGSMCRLISLNFKQLETKIGVYNHAIILMEPSNYQWLIRKCYGFDKDDISELFDVVIRIIQWYMIPLYHSVYKKGQDKANSDENITIKSNDPNFKHNDFGNNDDITETLFDDPSDDMESVIENENPKEYFECMTRLIKYLCKCFETLQKTYSSGNVVMSLQFYINLLQDSIEGKFDESKLPKCLIEREKEARNLLDYKKIKILWDFKKVKEVCELYDRCVFVHIDVHDSDKLPKIEGYLLAVDKFLSLREESFRALIQSSNSG